MSFPTPSDINAVRRGSSTAADGYDLAAVADHIKTNVAIGQKGDEGRYPDGPVPSSALAGKLVLFNNKLCPFGHRAWWAVEEKGLSGRPDFDYVHVNLGPLKPEWYKDTINPAGTVPCVYEDGRGVFESSVVVEYLQDRFPTDGTLLLPGDLVQRAAVRAFIADFNANFISPFYKALMNKDPEKDAELLAMIRDKVAALNKKLVAASAAGPYVFGDTFTAADINVAPFLYRFKHTLAFYRGVDLLPDGDEDSARVRQFLAAVSERPAFQRTAPSPEFLAAAYYSYAGGSVPPTAAAGAGSSSA